MTARARLAWMLAALASLPSCRTPTQIEVSVSTKIPCSGVTATSFTSGELGAIESAPPTTESTTCRGGHLGTVVLLPSEDDNAEVGFKVVTALNGETIETCSSAAAAGNTSCIVARRALRYLPHTELAVLVDMTIDCEGKVCDSTSTCVGGACKSATINDPSVCEGAGCDSTVLGPTNEDAGVDATVADATVIDATLEDAASADAADANDASSVDAAEASTPIDASHFLDAAPCDMGGLQPGSPWPMDGYCPNGRARSPLVGPASPVYKWHVDLPSGFGYAGATIAADGTVLVATTSVGQQDAPDAGGLVEAIYPDSGVRWTFAPPNGGVFDQSPVIAADSTVRFWEYNGAVYDQIALDGGAAIVNAASSIASRGAITIVSGGTMYTNDNSGNLYAFDDAANVLWHAGPISNDYSVVSVGANGALFLDDTYAEFHSVHPDGGSAWSMPIDAGGGLGPLILAPDGTLRVFGSDGYLYSYAAEDGAFNWRAHVDDPATISGFAISDDGTTFLATGSQIVGIDLAGNPAGHIAVTGGAYRPIVDVNGDVYVACNDGSSLCSFDHALTTLRWSLIAPGAIGGNAGTPVIGPGGMIYLISTEAFQTAKLFAFGPP